MFVALEGTVRATAADTDTDTATDTDTYRGTDTDTCAGRARDMIRYDFLFAC